MFTSIARLRSSNAQQSRVATVASNLKRLNPEWNDDWWFPVMAIGLSNSADDVSWVAGHPTVLLAAVNGLRLLRSARGTTVVSASKIIAVGSKTYKEIPFGGRNKTEIVSQALSELNEQLRLELNNPDYDWTHGLVEATASEVVSASVNQDMENKPKADDTAEIQAPEQGPDATAEIQAKARAVFLKVFPDVDDSTSTNRQGETKFANDRVRGKFDGFFAALTALENGVFTFGDVFPRH